MKKQQNFPLKSLKFNWISSSSQLKLFWPLFCNWCKFSAKCYRCRVTKVTFQKPLAIFFKFFKLLIITLKRKFFVVLREICYINVNSAKKLVITCQKLFCVINYYQLCTRICCAKKFFWYKNTTTERPLRCHLRKVCFNIPFLFSFRLNFIISI